MTNKEWLFRKCVQMVFDRLENNKRDLLEFIEEVLDDKTEEELENLWRFK